MLNKVPEVTIYFWIIKVLCTTVGETAADYLNENLGLGLTNTTSVIGGLLLVASSSSSGRAYVPAIYWLAVVLISVVGTLITDNLTDNLRGAAETTTIVFGVALAVTFAAWYTSERTLSIHTITRPGARPSTGWPSSSLSPWAPPRVTWWRSDSIWATARRPSCSGLIAAVAVAHFGFGIARC